MDKEDILKHREVFNKWLDGAEIQFYDTKCNKWIVVKDPNWSIGLKYRVKPRIELKDCHFNEIEYKVDKIGKVVEVRVDRLKINNSRTKSTLFKDKELAEAYSVLPELIRLRDEYNEGWKPDWDNDTNYDIHTIYYWNNTIIKKNTSNIRRVLAFKSEEIRNQFLEDHKDLIEIAKPLL